MDVLSIPALVNDYRQPEITDLINNTLYNIQQRYRILDSDWSYQDSLLVSAQLQVYINALTFYFIV